MKECKNCGSSNLVKNGIVNGKQRYKCRGCNKNVREGDKRVKYSTETRLRVLKMYLEGVGIMSIERIEGVPNPLIIYWLRHFGEILKEKLRTTQIPDNMKNIDIVELDELFTYCQKKITKSSYGLLLTETGIALLTLK